MRILVALGGNAPLRRGEPADAEAQRRNVEAAAAGLAALAAEHEVVLTHGNGPQVGLLALQSWSYGAVPPYPLDVLDAESEGKVGHLLELALRNALPEREIATVLTETVVDLDDPAFAEPTKPIGPVYSAAEAARLQAEHGWILGADGDGRRRLVPSPEPRAISELRAIRLLVDAGVLVICAGGGGIPVAIGPDGALRGVEGVVDKDLTAALLARRLDADLLLMPTDVDAVYLGWGTADQHPLPEAQADQLRAMGFAAGSMGPKVEAARRFVEGTGKAAAIGALADATRIVAGEAGTRIVGVASGVGRVG
ncbi:MAG TPA: carbamate kinase [Solirubrobacterales bacterium]|nr:carbamate kinase [Solirubrobacterales bacterium]